MEKHGPMARTASADKHDDSVKAVLDYVCRPDYRPMPVAELLRRLGVPKEGRAFMRRIVRDLIRTEKIARLGGRVVLSPEGPVVIRGRLALHPSGHGRVTPERGGGDVIIPAGSLGGAAHGDTVEARITRARRDGEKGEGEVIKVARRSRQRIVGLFAERVRGGMVHPFDPADGDPISIPGAFRMGAAGGDAVTVDLIRSAGPERAPEGKVLEILGPIDRPGVDVKVVALRHGLSLTIPEEVTEAADELPEAVPRKEAATRERFDDPPPVTIDGETARDFDDAVAVSELPDGGFRLFVHIADVAAFVPPGGILDLEARTRGTSVYFPDRVLPMFPEKLSNDLCSLRPSEDRLVQSVVLDFDGTAEVRRVRFADGVIRSAARLTYTQVAEVLEGTKRVTGVPQRIVPLLHAADRLREALEARRRARGSIDFDLPEPQILLDVEGVMTGITVTPRNRAHRLIEEFMIAANEAVAAYLEANGAPCLYRIHEQPDPLKIEGLAELARGFALKLPGDPATIRPGDIQSLLERAEGRPEHPLLAQVALRAMKQARYSAENAGHFGLASTVYCHFTSPIRRYPDLIVHRLLRALRHGGAQEVASVAEDLEALGAACSKLERESEAAERELLAWKKVAFIRGREGEAFDGLITGVTRFGLFVQLTENLVEGLLRVESLGDEWFEFVESRLELRGQRTGRTYRLGGPLRVVVQRVDAILRRVDLALEGTTGERSPTAGSGRRRAPEGRRGGMTRGMARRPRGRGKGRRGG